MVQQKIGIDLRGGKADFQLNYVQDKPIGAPFADFFANLHQYTGDDTLPQDPDGYGRGRLVRELPRRLRHMYTRDRLVAFPYDCGGRLHLLSAGPVRAALARISRPNTATGWSSRKDTTWKQLYEFAAFFKKLRDGGPGRSLWLRPAPGLLRLDDPARHPAADVRHGHWTEFDIDDKLGSKTPGPTNWGDEQSVLMMEKFKEQADVSHPDNLANGTLQLNTVYQAGQIAMQVQYHEFAASIEDEKT